MKAVNVDEVLKILYKYGRHVFVTDYEIYRKIQDEIVNLEEIKSESKIGHWMRMSDLSEQDDNRYKCSCCGNVVHYTDKMNLYTFNRWCGRCGSDNSGHINCEVEA